MLLNHFNIFIYMHLSSILLLLYLTTFSLFGSIYTSLTADKEFTMNSNKYEFSHISKACNSFSTIFYKALALNNEDNVVSSPFGLHAILSLLSYGANGSTAAQLHSALSLNDTDFICNEFKFLIPLFNDQENMDLSISNAIYVQNDFALLEDFLLTGKEHFHSDILNIDFSNKTNSAQQINLWAKEKTKDKINSLITEQDIDEYTRVILVNAIYFKSNWLKIFDSKNTKPRKFHVSKTLTKHVSTMFMTAHFHHGELPDLKARFLKIPYKNEDYDMVIVLPLEIDGLKSLEQKFNYNALLNASGHSTETALYLPKFQFEIMLNLEEILRKLNITTMFERSADFSKISEKSLCVSKVYQKIFIEINEQGCEAAAATVVQMRLKRSLNMPDKFIIDHPFMFIIQHKLSNIPLFIGSVKDLQHISQEKDEL